MPESDILSLSLKKLINHIESQNYRGYDPYDALKSPFFELPLLRSNKKLRFLAQQFVKRSPFNLRPLLGIPKGYNPVTLGLCIQGYSYLYYLTKHRIPNTEYRIPYNHGEYLSRIEFLISELKAFIPNGYSGDCWGYDFDWEARYATIPAYQPTVVATGIITNALYIAHKYTGNNKCAELVRSSAQFVLNDLKRTYSGDQYIFSYSPYDNQQVFNASMKGARILAQTYSLTGDKNFKNEAKKAVGFVISHQNPDGSWGYSLSSGGGWTDNYHTGYVLDSLDEYCHLCDDNSVDENLRKGYKFYKEHFIENDGRPRFYASKAVPADCTAAAQTILTLIRFGDNDLADSVASWVIRNMQSGTGSFYYRKSRNYTIKTSFMRWSDAWMFAALSELLAMKVKE